MIDKWRNLLEWDPKATYQANGYGFIITLWTTQLLCYNVQRTSSPPIGTNAISPCITRSNASRLVPTQDALLSGGNPLGISLVSFTMLKLSTPLGGQRRAMRRSLSSMANWPQVWDLAHSRKEVAFMWFIWHMVVTVNEWGARIVPTSISKKCVFSLPNTSKSVKHKFWDCIQARSFAMGHLHHAWIMRGPNW